MCMELSTGIIDFSFTLEREAGRRVQGNIRPNRAGHSTR